MRGAARCAIGFMHAARAAARKKVGYRDAAAAVCPVSDPVAGAHGRYSPGAHWHGCHSLDSLMKPMTMPAVIAGLEQVLPAHEPELWENLQPPATEEELALLREAVAPLTWLTIGSTFCVGTTAGDGADGRGHFWTPAMYWACARRSSTMSCCVGLRRNGSGTAPGFPLLTTAGANAGSSSGASIGA